MKHIGALTIITAFIAMEATSSLAYEVGTHAILSNLAVSQWLQNDPKAIQRSGLMRSVADDRQRFPNSDSDSRNVLLLIQDGARFEDGLNMVDFLRPLHHFFNPLNGGGLTIGQFSFTPSPDWALEDVGPVSGQDYSFRDAREYQWKALTSPDGFVRFRSFGALFQTMGQLIHHIQDMTAPQHVRNDAHCAYKVACGAYYNPSLFERLTDQEPLPALAQVVQARQYPAVYSTSDPSTFRVPRQFWTNAGKGIAEYTNRGFFSAGTIGGAVGDTFPSPVIGPTQRLFPERVDIKTLIPGTNLSGLLFFYANTVRDEYLGTDEADPRALTDSIFDADLAQYAPGQSPVYSLNTFNFASSRPLLIPRAVAYSAGLLHYFFRGDMEITSPDEGVYGVVDQSNAGCGNPCGFRKIKLKIRNATPGTGSNGEEPMGTGTLQAVAKYHLNTCYQANLSGEFGGTGFTGDGCRSKEESISVSAPYPIQSLSATVPQLVPFDFGASPIPINASDVFLQVVFQGKLGQEEGAVAVSTIDTAEPNFFAFANMTDYAYDTLDKLYHPLAPNAALNITNIRLQFDSGAGNPVASLASLSGGGHAQVAYLSDKGSVGLYIQYDYPGETISPYTTTELVNEFTADSDVGPYTRTCPVKKLRGLYRDDMFFVWQYVHGIISWRNLQGVDVDTDASSAGTIQSSRLTPKAASGGGSCVPAASLTGVKDFSQMTTQSITTATTWAIAF